MNQTKEFAATAAGTATDVFAAPGAGYNNRISGFVLSFSAAVSFQFLKEDGTTVLWQGPVVPADTPFSSPEGFDVLNTTANNKVKIKTSGSANVTGTVTGSIRRS